MFAVGLSFPTVLPHPTQCTLACPRLSCLTCCLPMGVWSHPLFRASAARPPTSTMNRVPIALEGLAAKASAKALSGVAGPAAAAVAPRAGPVALFDYMKSSEVQAIIQLQVGCVGGRGGGTNRKTRVQDSLSNALAVTRTLARCEVVRTHSHPPLPAAAYASPACPVRYPAASLPPGGVPTRALSV